jgi:hypothetical protein
MPSSHLTFQISEAALRHPQWVLVERVAASHCFQSSARLRDFLFYVADCALRDAPEEATEQQVGVSVFQRSPGYNCAEDNIVRTHARLLRQKLAEYFQNEGIREEIIIEIPKGHYLPIFQSSSRAVPILPAIVAPEKAFGSSRLVWLLIALLLPVCLAGAWWWHKDRTVNSSAINRFWDPFLQTTIRLSFTVMPSLSAMPSTDYDMPRPPAIRTPTWQATMWTLIPVLVRS